MPSFLLDVQQSLVVLHAIEMQNLGGFVFFKHFVTKVSYVLQPLNLDLRCTSSFYILT